MRADNPLDAPWMIEVAYIVANVLYITILLDRPHHIKMIYQHYHEYPNYVFEPMTEHQQASWQELTDNLAVKLNESCITPQLIDEKIKSSMSDAERADMAELLLNGEVRFWLRRYL